MNNVGASGETFYSTSHSTFQHALDNIAIQPGDDIFRQSTRHLSPQVFQSPRFQHEPSFKQPGCEDSPQGGVSLTTPFQSPLAVIPNAHHIEQPGYIRHPLQPHSSYGREAPQQSPTSRPRQPGASARRLNHALALVDSPARRGRRAQINQIFQNPEQLYHVENQSPASNTVSHSGLSQRARTIFTFPREDTRSGHALVHPHEGITRNYTTPATIHSTASPFNYQAIAYRHHAGRAHNTNIRYSNEQVASRPELSTTSPLRNSWHIQDIPTPHTPNYSNQSNPLISITPTFSAFETPGGYDEIAIPRTNPRLHDFAQITPDYHRSLPTSSSWSGDSEYLTTNPALSPCLHLRPRPRSWFARSESTQPRVNEWLSKISPPRQSPVRPPSPDPALGSVPMTYRNPSLLSSGGTSNTSGSSQSWTCRRGKRIETKHRLRGRSNSPVDDNPKVDPVDVDLVRQGLSIHGFCWWYIIGGKCNHDDKICKLMHQIPGQDILSEHVLKHLRSKPRTALCDTKRELYRETNPRTLPSWRTGSSNLETPKEGTGDPPYSQAHSKFRHLKQDTRMWRAQPTPTLNQNSYPHTGSSADEPLFQSSSHIHKPSSFEKDTSQVAVTTNSVFGNYSYDESKESLGSSASEMKSRWLGTKHEKFWVAHERWKKRPEDPPSSPTPQRTYSRPLAWDVPSWRAGKSREEGTPVPLSGRDIDPLEEPHLSNRRRDSPTPANPRTSLSTTLVKTIHPKQRRVDGSPHPHRRDQHSSAGVNLEEEVVSGPTTPSEPRHRQHDTEDVAYMAFDEQDGGVALSPLTSNVTIERGKGRLRAGGRFLPTLDGGVELKPYYP